MAVILAVVGVAFVAAGHRLSRRIAALELTAGALVWWMLLALLLALGEPLFSAVALWPLVGGVAALAVISLLRRPLPTAALLALAAAPGLVLLVPLLMLETFNVEQGPLVALPVLLMFLGSLFPQLLLITGRLVPQSVDHNQLSETHQERLMSNLSAAGCNRYGARGAQSAAVTLARQDNGR